MTAIKAYMGVARAPFLLLPVTLVAAGAGAAAYEGSWSLRRSLLALLGLVALHAAVNVLNEVSDMRTGIDLHTSRTPFSGGSGTLPAGLMTPARARAFGLACAALGLLVGVWFTLRIGWAMLPLLALGAFAVLGYTDMLARIGLGEIFAGLGLGCLPVWGTAFVQASSAGRSAVAAALPAFFMTLNLLFLNEFPDENADRAGGRRNLVLMLGRRAAAVVYAAAVLAVPVAIGVAVASAALPRGCLFAILPTLFSLRGLRWAFSAPAEPVPLAALGGNVAWNLATNAVLALTLFLAA
jgi:1,4-dihydroxy-2-naphthoate polyprenyltransferase